MRTMGNTAFVLKLLHSVITAFVVLMAMAVQSSAQVGTVRTTVDSVEILIGDQVNFDMHVSLPEGSTLRWPEFEDTLTSKLEIVTSSIPDTTVSDTAGTVIHQRLVLTSFDTGFIAIPPIGFIFNRDSSQLVRSEAQLLYVQDIPIDEQGEIKEIKEPYDVPFNWRKWLKVVLIGLLIIALAVLAFVLWRKYFRKEKKAEVKQVPLRPAHEIAFEKLEQLRQQKLWQNDRTKEFYIELSHIAREYMENRYGILAPEMTTDQIMSALKLKGVEAGHLASLKEALQLADLAKFAKYRPVASENEQCFTIIKEFVGNTLQMPMDEEHSNDQHSKA